MGDASDTYGGARALSAAALAGGCTTESIAAGNTCGAAADNTDWFFVDHPVTSPNKKIRVTLTFLFGFCGSTTMDGNLNVYWVPVAGVPPAQTPSQDGHGPGVKVCSSVNVGTVTEDVTCGPLPGGSAASSGRYFIEKVRAAGSGAHNLRVQFV